MRIWTVSTLCSIILFSYDEKVSGLPFRFWSVCWGEEGAVEDSKGSAMDARNVARRAWRFLYLSPLPPLLF